MIDEENHSLDRYTDSDLLFELEKRKKIKILPPNQKQKIDDTQIRSFLNSIVEQIVDGSWHEDNDDASYLYEDIFTLYYGSEFWEWKRNYLK